MTATKVDISKIKINGAIFTDKYYAKPKVAKVKKTEGEFFKTAPVFFFFFFFFFFFQFPVNGQMTITIYNSNADH